jgi:hypothetical protein
MPIFARLPTLLFLSGRRAGFGRAAPFHYDEALACGEKSRAHAEALRNLQAAFLGSVADKLNETIPRSPSHPLWHACALPPRQAARNTYGTVSLRMRNNRH